MAARTPAASARLSCASDNCRGSATPSPRPAAPSPGKKKTRTVVVLLSSIIPDPLFLPNQLWDKAQVADFAVTGLHPDTVAAGEETLLTLLDGGAQILIDHPLSHGRWAPFDASHTYRIARDPRYISTLVTSPLFLTGFRGWATILGLIESSAIRATPDPSSGGYLLSTLSRKRKQPKGTGNEGQGGRHGRHKPHSQK